MDTVLIGTMTGTTSDAIVHAVEMVEDTKGGQEPVLLCNNTIDLHPHKVETGDIHRSMITCVNCHYSLRKRIEMGTVYNFRAPDLQTIMYDNEDTQRMRAIIQFAKLYKKTCEPTCSCQWFKGNHTCTYESVGSYYDFCSWERCLSIFLDLNYGHQPKLNTFMEGLKKVEDAPCEKCFAEGDNKCEGCGEYNDYPHFLAQDEIIDDPPCNDCFYIITKKKCFECNDNNSWMNYLPRVEDNTIEKKCSTCRFSDPDFGAEGKCEAYCDENYSKWEPIERKNGLVELPFGIKERTVWSYTNRHGKTEDAPSFENALFWTRRSLLANIFKEAQDFSEDESVDGVIRAMCTDPDKYLEMLTTVLKPVEPQGEK